MNIMENYPKYAISGRLEIHPCVLQDIGPLGLLPYSHSTSSADHSKQGIGYRWSLDDYFTSRPSSQIIWNEMLVMKLKYWLIL